MATDILTEAVPISNKKLSLKPFGYFDGVRWIGIPVAGTKYEQKAFKCRYCSEMFLSKNEPNKHIYLHMYSSCFCALSNF